MLEKLFSQLPISGEGEHFKLSNLLERLLSQLPISGEEEHFKLSNLLENMLSQLTILREGEHFELYHLMKEGTLLKVLGGLAMPYTVTHWIWVVEEHNEVPNLMEGLIYRVNLKQ